MEQVVAVIEVVQPWVYRVSFYLSNAFVDDPAILAFAFCWPRAAFERLLLARLMVCLYKQLG